MHSQSDFGYSIGGIEARDRLMCARNARFSLKASRDLRIEPERRAWWHANAKAWLAEGRAYPRMLTKAPVFVGTDTGMYPQDCTMRIVAITLRSGVLYQGRGTSKAEALDDLALRMNVPVESLNVVE